MIIERLKTVGQWALPLTPVSLLGTVDWQTVGTKTAGFLIAMAASLTATATIAIFFRKHGREVVRAWTQFLDLPRMLNGIRDELTSVRRDIRVHDSKMKAFQDAGSVKTFEADPTGRWKWVSDSLELFVGCQPHEFLGLNWLTQVDEAERTSVSREYASAIMERRTFDCNVLFRRREGDKPDQPERWVRLIASPVMDGEEVVCYTGHGRALDAMSPLPN